MNKDMCGGIYRAILQENLFEARKQLRLEQTLTSQC